MKRARLSVEIDMPPHQIENITALPPSSKAEIPATAAPSCFNLVNTTAFKWHRHRFEKLGKLLRLRHVVRNWLRTVLDHIHLTKANYVCHLRNGLSFDIRG